jgi:hypothetical protein
MPKHHPSDFLVPIAADVVERILALHFKSELCRLVFSPTLAFGQGYPFANNLALCIFSEHGRSPDPRQEEDIGGLRHFKGLIRLSTPNRSRTAVKRAVWSRSGPELTRDDAGAAGAIRQRTRVLKQWWPEK